MHKFKLKILPKKLDQVKSKLVKIKLLFLYVYSMIEEYSDIEVLTKQFNWGQERPCAYCIHALAFLPKFTKICIPYLLCHFVSISHRIIIINIPHSAMATLKFINSGVNGSNSFIISNNTIQEYATKTVLQAL